jgi:hypothetical protein
MSSGSGAFSSVAGTAGGSGGSGSPTGGSAGGSPTAGAAGMITNDTGGVSGGGSGSGGSSPMAGASAGGSSPTAGASAGGSSPAGGASGGSGSGGSSSNSPPGFHVTPWAIYDPDGKEFLAKGADVAGPGMWWNELVLNETAALDCWKFNLVRLLISYNGAVGSHDTIDAVVNYFTPKKIVVVIATVDNPTAHWSDSQFSSSTGAYQNWLRTIAAKYKNNPYVWYSIVGENGDSCGDCTQSQWLPSNQQLLKVMRDDAGASNVFLSLGNTWGQEAGCVSGNIPTAKSCFLSWGDQLRKFNGKDYSGQGVVYELHPYEQWNESEARLANYVDRNQALGNYVWFSDYAESNGGGAASLQALEYVIDQAQTRRLALGGMWSFPGDPTGTPGDCLCTPGCTSGASISSCDNPSNLTDLGKRIWANTHRDETLYPANIRTPVPAHSATGVATSASISWDAIPNATSYDVYFGTSTTPGQSQSVGNQTATSYKPASLQANTDYYWRVNPKNSNGTTTGGVMHFQTGQ